MADGLSACPVVSMVSSNQTFSTGSAQGLIIFFGNVSPPRPVHVLRQVIKEVVLCRAC